MAESPEAVHSPSREALRAHLEQLLASTHFRNSKRCSALLRYVVEHSVGNPHEPIKERVIGQAVFDRDPGYDTNQDAVVRNAAAEVRKRLAQYYLESGPSPDGLRIELPPGSYLPEFRSVSVSVGLPPTTRSWTAAWPWALALGLAMVTGVAGWLLGSQRSTPPAATELDQFWGPVLSAHTPVQICVGQSRMSYFPEHLEGNASPSATVPRKALVPMWDRFFWFGDAIAMSHVTAYLTGHSKLYRIRGARNTPYAELQGNPVVLIGAFNNEWTIRLTEDLRFSLVNDSPTVRGVRDREQGKDITWRVERSPQGWIADEDYAVITRLVDPHSGLTVVAIGGITTYGTLAAGNFVTTPEMFRQAIQAAPADWSRKNMQVVLETKVADNTPGPPRVLITHFW